jgi:phosphate-selective porin OprO/OprP
MLKTLVTGGLLVSLLLLTSSVAPAADAAGAERVVIEDVNLIGRKDPSGDFRVNVLIVGGKLDMVTRSDLVKRPDDIALNAGGGFLMGQLAIGELPSFVIIDRDPREHFEVLLDTQAHVRFAMHEGEIVKNELPEAGVSPRDATPSQRPPTAYVPPPIAVPIRYYDARKWNKFDTKPVSGLVIGALIMDHQVEYTQDSDSRDQVGSLSAFESGEIRAFRFGLVGTLNFKRPWAYAVYANTKAFDRGFESDNDDDLTWDTYRLDIPLPADLTLSLGKQKEPISMERLMPLTFTPWQERTAAVDALLPARNHGVVLSGTAAGDWVSWSVGAFNNWKETGESFGDASSQLIGRVTWVPLVSDDESNLLHFGFGLRRSNTQLPVSARRQPEFNNAPKYVDTGPIMADDVMAYSLEAYWRKGPYLVGFEYLGSDVDSTDSGDPYFHGFHLSGSWAVTGEMRSYRKRSGIFNPLPVARPVHQGGWGTLETAFRYSRLDLTDGTVEGGEMDVYSLGLNWWLTRWAQFSVNYRHILLDRDDTEGASSGLNARLVLTLD